MTTSEFDYVIVGAGSAGCTLANRLTEDPNNRVLVLEAGGWDTDFWIKLPLGWGKVYGERRHDWHYDTEPETHAGNRKMEVARGKVIGGSSSTNAMAYVRGHRGDFDRWAENGARGWSYKDVLPYFKKQESWEGGENDYRGGSGPLTTRRSRYADPLVDAYFEAAGQAGHPFNEDYNGAEQHGLARMQATIRNGRRCSTAVAYLRPALSRSNLSVEINAQATRVVFEGNRAVGIEYRQNGETRRRACARRKFCSAAAPSTRRSFSMLSGVGAPERTGRQAQDCSDRRAARVSARICRITLRLCGLVAAMAADRFRRTCVSTGWLRPACAGALFGTGFTTDLPGGIIGFLKTQYAKCTAGRAAR